MNPNNSQPSQSPNPNGSQTNQANTPPWTPPLFIPTPQQLYAHQCFSALASRFLSPPAHPFPMNPGLPPPRFNVPPNIRPATNQGEPCQSPSSRRWNKEQPSTQGSKRSYSEARRNDSQYSNRYRNQERSRDFGANRQLPSRENSDGKMDGKPRTETSDVNIQRKGFEHRKGEDNNDAIVSSKYIEVFFKLILCRSPNLLRGSDAHLQNLITSHRDRVPEK